MCVYRFWFFNLMFIKYLFLHVKNSKPHIKWLEYKHYISYFIYLFIWMFSRNIFKRFWPYFGPNIALNKNVYFWWTHPVWFGLPPVSHVFGFVTILWTSTGGWFTRLRLCLQHCGSRRWRWSLCLLSMEVAGWAMTTLMSPFVFREVGVDSFWAGAGTISEHLGILPVVLFTWSSPLSFSFWRLAGRWWRTGQVSVGVFALMGLSEWAWICFSWIGSLSSDGLLFWCRHEALLLAAAVLALFMGRFWWHWFISAQRAKSTGTDNLLRDLVQKCRELYLSFHHVIPRSFLRALLGCSYVVHTGGEHLHRFCFPEVSIFLSLIFVFQNTFAGQLNRWNCLFGSPPST